MIRYLCSVRFSVILIAAALLFVVAGTVIEGVTDSHAQAAVWTYRNPLFLLLLGGFFVNILGSALKRWPFRKGHIPFLVAHLGLLMVLTGVCIKVTRGVQGQLVVVEGSGSSHLLVPQSRAFLVEGRGGASCVKMGRKEMTAGPLQLKVLEYSPHSEERFEFWTKGSWVTLEGVPPFPADGSERQVIFPGGKEWKVVGGESAKGPALAFQVEEECERVVAHGASGEVQEWYFDRRKPESILSLDEGFDGYAVRLRLPYRRLSAGVADLPSEVRTAAFWANELVGERDDVAEALREKGWPLSEEVSDYQALAGQLIRVSDHLPVPEGEVDVGRFVSAFEHLPLDHLEELPEEIELYTPVTTVHLPVAPLRKLEENRPVVKVWVSDGEESEIVSLRYDPLGRGLKWPVLGGKYVMRFQPERIPLPHHVRLREARAIRYAGSEQPYSYEADLWLDGKEVTLSMNRVYQTGKGYRFYMAGLQEEGGRAKRAQLVVNRDPAKWVLTYPGGVLVSLGFVMFGLQRRKKQ